MKRSLIAATILVAALGLCWLSPADQPAWLALMLVGMTIPVRIVHDAAHVSALSCVEIISPLLREEEKETAYREFYKVIHAGLEAAFIFYNRERLRLHPLAQAGGDCEQN